MQEGDEHWGFLVVMETVIWLHLLLLTQEVSCVL